MARMPGGEAAASLARLCRRHPAFGVLLVCGVAIRFVVWRAYRPALLFPDSRSYLHDAFHLGLDKLRPSGYSFLLWPLIRVGDLSLVAAVQHVLGLGVATLVYVLLVRHRVPKWAACLAAVPVLFDSLQLDLEQYVMSDIAFEALVVGGCALFVWRDRSRPMTLASGGLLLGLAAVTRSAGLGLVLAVVLAAVAARVGWRRGVAAVAAFALPVVTYAACFYAHRGVFALSDHDGRYLYARLAPLADCRGLRLPSMEQALCPRQPLGERYTTNVYMWDLARSPQYQIGPFTSHRVESAIADWDRRIIAHQPSAYARLVAIDLVKGFRPFRTVSRGDVAPTPWLFQLHYPDNAVERPGELLAMTGSSGATVDEGKARFLVAYQRYAHVPGPLLALCLVGGLAVAVAGRSRRSPARRTGWLFAVTCITVLVPAALASEFSWRYQLPQLALLPTAGIAAATVLLRRGGPDDVPWWTPGTRRQRVVAPSHVASRRSRYVTGR
jgi:hypothetical protein